LSRCGGRLLVVAGFSCFGRPLVAAGNSPSASAFERVSVTSGRIVIDGTSLTCGQVTAVARGTAQVTVADAALAAARAAWRVAGEVAARQPVYGRNTGVGANRVVGIAAAEGVGHGLRLLRSHAAGAGPLLAPELARAMLVVRLNQIGAGGSGVDPAVLPVLADAINRGFTPPVPLYGAIGTGDLTALASTGLCLLGERSWQPRTEPSAGQPPAGEPPAAGSPVAGPPAAGPPAAGPTDGGPPPRFELNSADALAFMSSNAATLGESALACCDLAGLLRSTVVIAALSLVAAHASLEPYAEKVHLACPHPGQQWVAASVRALMDGVQVTPSRVQDPYGFRAFPQVHGPAVDAVGYADAVVVRELNAAGENPLIDVEGQRVWHNGNFHAAYVGLALDTTRAALFQTAALSAARLGVLVEPSFTGLNPFQADTVTSSGIMILEYVAHSAVADIRRFATPAALGNAVLSRGVEEHAGFSTQSAHSTGDAVSAYRVVLACELVAAVRALRMQGRAPAAGSLGRAYALADAVLDPRTADRPLDEDVAAAAGILGEYASLCP
jgi:histidine ammonia-lyase